MLSLSLSLSLSQFFYCAWSTIDCVTESFFFLGGSIGRDGNDFSLITFIEHNQKSNGGGGGGPCPTHSYTTVVYVDFE